jgi:5-formyltetrahydrofolate cyclo-ligase
VPIVTTVHDLQVVADFPTDAHDIELSVIVTPSEVIETGAAVKRASLDWDSLSSEDLEEMPLLKQLAK